MKNKPNQNAATFFKTLAVFLSVMALSLGVLIFATKDPRMIGQTNIHDLLQHAKEQRQATQPRFEVKHKSATSQQTWTHTKKAPPKVAPTSALEEPPGMANKPELSVLSAQEKMDQGNDEEAISMLEELVEKSPNDSMAVTELAFAYLDVRNESLRAFDYFEKSLKLNPKDPFVLDAYVQIAQAHGLTDKAYAFLNELGAEESQL